MWVWFWVRKIPWSRKWHPTPAFLESFPSRGTCQAIVCGVTKSWAWLGDWAHTHTHRGCQNIKYRKFKTWLISTAGLTFKALPYPTFLWTMWSAAEFLVLEGIQTELDAHALGILEKGCLLEELFERLLLDNYSSWLTQKCLLVTGKFKPFRYSWIQEYTSCHQKFAPLCCLAEISSAFTLSWYIANSIRWENKIFQIIPGQVLGLVVRAQFLGRCPSLTPSL